ncbi:RNA 2',3'-cyclic phosphodiesterase [Oceanobacillus sp. CFH 90083]|uniref:RNA 2',3'-cyclic phosphodiesterase n=1 Tax=Oceanobacillus sp. CFH 90083 TaxID=2592336 RepID=UPI00128CC8AD|nr:RNA 2',3'-cyclic phosphodiesterase [Oceanobacillus sp. CFH 90083]
MSHYFIGIQIKPEWAKVLSEWQKELVYRLPYKQWTDKLDFHITLVFLGNIDEKSLDALRNGLQAVTAYAPFTLKKSKLGTFGNKQQPRVLWLGIENNSILSKIQKQVVQTCETVGYRKEKRMYTPHITIGKKWTEQEKTLTANGWNDILSGMPFLDEAFQVDAIHLYKVHPASKPKYEIIQSFPLRGEE